MEDWLDAVAKVTDEDWSSASLGKAYLKSKAEGAARLVVLLDGGIMLRRKGARVFEAYGFEEEFEKVQEKYADYLSILHGMVFAEGEIEEKEKEEEVLCLVEFRNARNDFYKYVIGIREKEEL